MTDRERRAGDLRLDRRHQAVRRVHRRRRPRPDHPAGVVLRPARPVRLRQDHDAADGRRARGADRRADPASATTDITDARPYQRPVNTVFQSYALFPHLDVFENVAFGLRRRGAKDVEAEVERGARARRAAAPGRPQAGPALRRPAAARRAGPGHRQPARGAAARRAARRPRPQAAPPDADRAQADPDRGRPHLRPRHARPGGGHDHGRHHRGDERRPARAARRPGRRSTSCRASTFVANFLGQSNLLRAARGHRPRRRPRASPTCTASKLDPVERAPARRTHGDVWLGRAAREAAPRRRRAAGRNGDDVRGRRSIDVSFTGVTTQYLVRMPWGRERGRSSQQNHGIGARPASASDVAICRGTRTTRSASTPPQDADAGASRRRGASHGRDRRSAGHSATGPQAPPGADAGCPTCCSSRACCGWSSSSSLPMVTLLSQSLQAGPGRRPATTTATGNVAHLRRRAQEYWPQLLPLVRLRRPRHGRSRFCSATRWPTPSRSRPGAGEPHAGAASSRRSSRSSSCAPWPGGRSWPTTGPVGRAPSTALHILLPRWPHHRDLGSRWSPASPTTSCRS